MIERQSLMKTANTSLGWMLLHVGGWWVAGLVVMLLTNTWTPTDLSEYVLGAIFVGIMWSLPGLLMGGIQRLVFHSLAQPRLWLLPVVTLASVPSGAIYSLLQPSWGLGPTTDAMQALLFGEIDVVKSVVIGSGVGALIGLVLVLISRSSAVQKWRN